MTTVHAEIEYTNKDGVPIHSDICPPEHDSKNMTHPEYRQLMHNLLDEWLDESNGTGMFYIMEEGYRYIMSNYEYNEIINQK